MCIVLLFMTPIVQNIYWNSNSAFLDSTLFTHSLIPIFECLFINITIKLYFLYFACVLYGQKLSGRTDHVITVMVVKAKRPQKLQAFVFAPVLCKASVFWFGFFPTFQIAVVSDKTTADTQGKGEGT